jgi:hypothetical protein
MFIAVFVALVTEAMPWIHNQAFYLGELFVFENEKTAPWAVPTILFGHAWRLFWIGHGLKIVAPARSEARSWF